ncbi:hypothetical protein GVAV_000261 [Gurleya vavrai]
MKPFIILSILLAYIIFLFSLVYQKSNKDVLLHDKIEDIIGDKICISNFDLTQSEKLLLFENVEKKIFKLLRKAEIRNIFENLTEAQKNDYISGCKDYALLKEASKMAKINLNN